MAILTLLSFLVLASANAVIGAPELPMLRTANDSFFTYHTEVLSFSGDGARFVVLQREPKARVTVFDVATLKSVADVGLSDPYRAALDATGRQALITCNRQLVLWKVDERSLSLLPRPLGREIDELSNFGSPRFTMDGRAVALPFSRGNSTITALAVIDVESRRIRQVCDAKDDPGVQRGGFGAFDVAADGKWAISGDGTGGVIAWDLAGGGSRQKLRRGFLEREETRALTWALGTPETIYFVRCVPGEERLIACCGTMLSERGQIIANQLHLLSWRHDAKAGRWTEATNRRLPLDDDLITGKMAITRDLRFVAVLRQHSRAGALVSVETGDVAYQFTMARDPNLPDPPDGTPKHPDDEAAEKNDRFDVVTISPDGRKLYAVTRLGTIAEFEMPLQK